MSQHIPEVQDVETKEDVEFVENSALALDVEHGIKPIHVADAAYIPVGGLTMSEEEKKLNSRINLKMDFLMLPIMVVLYLFNGMDRGNIGNAATVDFIKTAGLSTNAINNAASFFFITFVPLQPVSAGFGKYIGVARWLPACMFCWGVITFANGFVHGDAALYALRMLIGVFECGFYPMATFFISTMYPRFQLGFRLSMFYGSYTIAGCFSGLVAYGILQWNNKPLHAWQYLFIVEGSLTMGIGLFAFFYLPREACTAWFLNEEEKAWARERMLRDSGDANQARRGLTKRDIVEALKDWKLWIIIPPNICSSVPYQAFSVFLPLIVQQLGYESYRANLFAVPIYFVGACGLWLFAFSSDHFKERTIHILTALLFVIVGAILVTTVKAPAGRYASLCILNIGAYTMTPLVASSLMNNTPSPGKRIVIMAIQGYGNLGGVIAGQLFKPKYAPTYRTPFFASLGLVIFAWIMYFVYRMIMVYENKKRAKIIADWTPEQIAEENTNSVRLGDKKYTFVYTL